jgi:8-oxo-dGTP pyrophosphatase MutT (NUDIX family)
VEPDSVREAFRGRLIRVDVERWPSGEREIVRHPGACAVVAFTPLGDVLLVRQTREAVRTELLEIPAGIRDQPDESVVDCAARELMEETGFRAARIQPLGAIYTSPGFADEKIDLFLADAVPDGERTEIGLEVVLMPFAAALSAMGDGRIMDAKTVAGLLLARDVQDRRGQGAPPGSASG